MSFDNKQIRLLLGLLAGATAVIAILYLVVLRSPLVPVYQNIREGDASAIIAELDRAGIPYRLENGGHDILVPEDQAAQVRLLIAGSEIPMGGTVGFELFNESDMGLTEFAQKINFQRALQGELARTIMSMEGVEFARVHLAMAERSIFRPEQGEPTAAVTLQMNPGTLLTKQRIDGVRQLVASSVPNLLPGAVVVLDAKGNLVSSASTPDNGYGAPRTEREALEQYYQTIAHQVVARALPATRFEVIVNTRSRLAGDSDWLERESSDSSRHNLALSVLVRTQTDIEAEDRIAAEAALVEALQLDLAHGDSLVFSVGLINADKVSPIMPAGGRESSPQAASVSVPTSWTDTLFTRWTLFGLALLAILVAALRPRRLLSEQEAEDFGDLLKRAVAEREVTDVR